MRVDDFDYHLPEELIALRPVNPRDAARLLVVEPGAEAPFADCKVTDLPQLLSPGDALVFNDTKVIPAELTGTRERDGSRSSLRTRRRPCERIVAGGTRRGAAAGCRGRAR